MAPKDATTPVHEPDIEVEVEPCSSSEPSHCNMASGGWGDSKLRHAFRRFAGPLGVILVGWWLVLLPVRPLAGKGVRWLGSWFVARWNQTPH